jgi:hypothetical protein
MINLANISFLFFSWIKINLSLTPVNMSYKLGELTNKKIKN